MDYKKNIQFDISDEYIDELKERTIKLLHSAGMYNIKTINIFGKQIDLAKDLELNQNNQLLVSKNEFRFGFYPCIIFDFNLCQISYNVLLDFSDFYPIIAAMLLWTKYSKTFDSEISKLFINCEERYTGWFNYLFNEKYYYNYTLSPWNVYSKYNYRYYWDSIVSYCLENEVSSYEMDTLLSVLCYDKIKNSGRISDFNYYLRAYINFDNGSSNDKKQKLLSYITDCDCINSENNKWIENLKPYFYELPKILILKCITDVFELDFWKEYKPLEDFFIFDLKQKDNIIPKKVLAKPLDTFTVLGLESFFKPYFCDNTNELDELTLNDLEKFKKEYNDILENEKILDKKYAQNKIIDVIINAQKFSSMHISEDIFNEFIKYADIKPYQAFILAIDKFINENSSENVYSRTKLKSYICSLLNYKFRKNYYGF